MFIRNFDFCKNCNLCYTYAIMLFDDDGVLRTYGEPEDKCGTCNSCHNCCKCLMIATDINTTSVKM